MRQPKINSNKLESERVLSQLSKKRRKRKGKTTFDDFEDRYYSSIAILVKIQMSKLSSMLVNEARKNLIVNFVTAIEVFCKNIILTRAGRWDEEGISKMLDVPFNLRKAYELFSKAKVSRE